MPHATPPKLTARQRELVEIIRDYIASRGFPPTQAEAAARMGINTRACGRMAARIVAAGFLTSRGATARSWVPVGDPDSTEPAPRRRKP
jgi:hypothetical protein